MGFIFGFSSKCLKILDQFSSGIPEFLYVTVSDISQASTVWRISHTSPHILIKGNQFNNTDTEDERGQNKTHNLHTHSRRFSSGFAIGAEFEIFAYDNHYIIERDK